MVFRVLSVWSRFGSNRTGFFSGTLLLVILMLLIYAGGLQASLSLGPEGDFPRFRDVFLNALSHDDPPSLLADLCFLLLVGPCQEGRWGTVAFLALSALTAAVLPCAYALLLLVFGGEASRVCGYSGVQLALFTAQCRQAAAPGRGRRLRGAPLWLLPWVALLVGLLALPATPALLHFCAICVGHNYHQSFIRKLQELERLRFLDYVPDWVYVSTSSRLRLPTFSRTDLSSHSQTQCREEPPATPHRSSSSGTAPPVSVPGTAAVPVWALHHGLTEAEVLEEEMLRAGIQASLQDTPESKVEVSKSSVSSLRLQQLERMGFPTEKAVLALAASRQLEGAVSLLINDSVGEQAVVVGAKAPGGPPPNR